MASRAGARAPGVMARLGDGCRPMLTAVVGGSMPWLERVRGIIKNSEDWGRDDDRRREGRNGVITWQRVAQAA